MRMVRVLAAILLTLLIIAAALYAFRLPLAGYGARAAMKSAGLDNARAQVTALSFNAIRLEDVAAGPQGAEGFFLESVEADFRLGRLLSARTADALRVGPGTVRLTISPEGEVSIPGVAIPSGNGGGESDGAPLPFDRLALNDVALIADTPEGGAAGTISADYDVQKGGQFLLSAESEMAEWKAFRIENAQVELRLTLSIEGRARLAVISSGSAITPEGTMREARIIGSFSGESWRDLAAGKRDDFLFGGRDAIDNAVIPVQTAPSLAAILEAPWARAALGDAAQTLTVSTDGFIDIKADQIAVSVFEGVFVRSDTGAALTITGPENAPLYVLDGEGMRLDAGYRLEGTPLTAEGRIAMTPLPDGWRIEAPARLNAFAADGLSFDAAEIVLDAEAAPQNLRADLAVKTLIREAALGPATVYDAPIETAFAATADLANRRARIGLSEACIETPRMRVNADAPAMETAFSGVSFCPQGEDFAVVDWSDGFNLTAEGVLTAQTARIAMGETVFAGTPPRIDGRLQFDGAAGASRLAGGFTGGRVLFNDMLIFSDADGDFTLSLDADGMRGEGTADRVRVAQNLEAPLVAPVIASGAGRLADNAAAFSYSARTPSGDALGAGEGTHNLQTGRGEAAFAIDNLLFVEGGLQPETLTPVLRGVIDNASGAASGRAQFDWAPETLNSSAEIVLDSITFAGPTRVVTQTRGVDGALRFSSLWPVATGGEQTITVTGVDLDSLLLEEGEIVFELPGDDSLRIARASFPWFGGRIGVYEATASYAGGGAALAPLRAESIDLKQVLEYFNINGLSGEGLLSGMLPLVVEGGKAQIEGGFLESDGPGALRYQSAATDQAATAGDQAQVAFDLLRDLRYDSLSVAINGPLDGRLSFQMRFEGSGEVAMNNQDVRVPVTYNINLDAALLELLNQANLTRDIQLQFERGLGAAAESEDAAKE